MTDEEAKTLQPGQVIQEPDLNDLFLALGMSVVEDTMSRKWPTFIQVGDRAVSVAFDSNGKMTALRIE